MKTRVSVYAFAVHDDRVLLTQLAPYCYRAGHWALPGGGMDHGEQPLQTLMRETWEESGLRAEAPELLDVRSYSESSERGLYMAVQIIYRVRLQGEPRVIEEGGSTADVRWVPLEELAELPMVPFTKSFLEDQGLVPAGV